ncbi:alpha/beta hydrolase [Micromonospora sp. NPDC005222]|uniref:alpha/beta hydrolase n=2 Tax=Micromonospora TaxID=1873 RepID=UPI0033A8AAD7
MPLDRMLKYLIAWQSADGSPIPDRELTLQQARARYRESAMGQRHGAATPGPAVASADRLVDGADGSSVAVRIFTPESAGDRVVTYLHGGGWVLGDLDSHDWVCRDLAASLGAVVVSVDYRRAPEFPHPAPLRDAVAAARWVAASFPGRRHLIAGDSAGGSLALGVALVARDLRPAALLLIYPALDPSLAIASASPCAEGYLLSVRDLAWSYDQYLPDPHRRADPAVDLLKADFRGLPPTIVATAEYDPLRDEGVELVARMRAAGVRARHVPGEGLVHGYFLMQGMVPSAADGARRVIQETDQLLEAVAPGPDDRPAPDRAPAPDAPAHDMLRTPR